VATYEFPTSFGQRWMWLLAQIDPGEPVYNISWALWLDGTLDVEALQQAWDAALVKHEALRTTFRNASGVPLQVIEDESAGQPVPFTSVAQLDADKRRAAALASIRELARIPFDLATGPLVRPILVRLSPQAHVLAVVMHHIVADGWSFRILFDELAADYAAITGGQDRDGAEPPIQYADFAIWQVEHADGGGYAPAERFWRTELAGVCSALPLPTDRPYPARQTFAAQRIATAIDARLADTLREVAAGHGTTLFVVLLAAYAVVLARLTGSDDLVVAVPMAARTRAETESVVGLFANTVAVRVRVEEDRTLGELLRSVHAASAQALAHQDLPFARVVELLRPARDGARLPLVQVMFSMEESWALPERGGLRWHPELVDNGTAKFELELAVTDAPGGPQVQVDYNRELFQPATGQLVTDGFLAVLRSIGADPGQQVARVEIMPAGLLGDVTGTWPDAGPVPGTDTTALGLLRAACAGDAVLATGSDGDLTGDQIRTVAARITAALRAGGVGVGDRVAILLPRGARLLPAILGVWSAGASYVPLDPIYPDQRLATMLADSGAAAVVVDSGAPGEPVTLPAQVPVPTVDLSTLSAAEPAAVAGVPDLPPSAVAVTIFTSGSTGRPKAINVTQGGLAALLRAVQPLLALGPQDRFVAVSTFAFDIALVELLAPVLAGGRVVVADPDQVLDAPRLRELLTAQGATAMQATPAGWRMLLDAGGIPPGVRLRVTAGEPLPRDLADAMGTGPGVRVWNLYGPTETTIYSGGAQVGPAPEPIEIGSVIAGTQLYVLDDRLRPVPPGVTGEVYIGGAGVAHGYHGAPAMTAHRFVPDPFGGRPGARLYATGDLGRWRWSGRIELAGRADRQIKIRGYRIESGEIEAALREHADVTQAVVSVRGGGNDVRLVGYLVTGTGAADPPEGLREHLRERLPDYMVPATFVVLPALPLTGSGKIDHQALPEPDWGGGNGRTRVVPRTPVEARIAAIFAELLTLPAPVGVTDNFFTLGGHSLTATRVMARIRDAYGVDLPIRVLFADPTVAGLAVAVAAANGGVAGPPGPARRSPRPGTGERAAAGVPVDGR